MIKSRKGILMDNTLSIIIAVLGLAVLLGAIALIAYNWYFADAAKAKMALNTVGDKIDYLNPGESTKFPLRTVEGWVFVGWNKSDTTRPDKCFLSSCICICKPDIKKIEFSFSGLIYPEYITIIYGPGKAPVSNFFAGKENPDQRTFLRDSCQSSDGFCRAIKESAIDLYSLRDEYRPDLDYKNYQRTTRFNGIEFPAVKGADQLVEIQIQRSKVNNGDSITVFRNFTYILPTEYAV
jgi:hypothetical protein